MPSRRTSHSSLLVELFCLLIIELQEQRVSIGVSVEIAIVSVLREVIVNGVLDTEWQQIRAVCLFLATTALLLVVRVWLPPPGRLYCQPSLSAVCGCETLLS